MRRIADIVTAAGYYAYVEQTGGGVATIYAYRSPALPSAADVNGMRQQPDVMAGPGSYWADNGPTGYLSEFYSGTTAVDAATMDYGDDDYATDSYTATARDTEVSLAGRIIHQLETLTARYGARPLTCTALRDAQDAETGQPVAQCQNVATLLAVVADDPDSFERRPVCAEHANDYVHDTFNLRLVLRPL